MHLPTNGCPAVPFTPIQKSPTKCYIHPTQNTPGRMCVFASVAIVVQSRPVATSGRSRGNVRIRAVSVLPSRAETPRPIEHGALADGRVS
jgi:hypothetical protein